MRHLPLLLVMAACDPAHITVHAPDATAEQRSSIEEAGDRLDLDLRWSDDRWGALHIEIRDRCKDDYCGYADDKRGCRRSAWSIDNPRVIAHEISHMLHLQHEPETYMAQLREDQTEEITDEQYDDVAFGARKFAGLCRTRL